jgi:hypothetical protein
MMGRNRRRRKEGGRNTINERCKDKRQFRGREDEEGKEQNGNI